MTYFYAVRRPRRHAWRGRSGFTLVEMLIVLGIIGILAAILFPIFQSARESARRATCSSNLKQIGLGIAMYARDHNGFYPNHANGFVGQNHNCAWADRIARYVPGTANFQCPSSNSGIYKPGCPPDSQEVDAEGYMINWDGSYSLNALTFRNHFTVHESRLQHPADTISVLDGRGGLVTIGFDPIPDVEVLKGSLHKPRHGEGYNVLWMDGHVKWRTLDSLVDRRLWIAANQVPAS